MKEGGGGEGKGQGFDVKRRPSPRPKRATNKPIIEDWFTAGGGGKGALPVIQPTELRIYILSINKLMALSLACEAGCPPPPR